MRINKTQDIKAIAYGLHGQIMVIVHDSGFSSLAEVLAAAQQRASHAVHELSVFIEDTQEYARYTVKLNRLIKK